jgi:hypothetical protein
MEKYIVGRYVLNVSHLLDYIQQLEESVSLKGRWHYITHVIMLSTQFIFL